MHRPKSGKTIKEIEKEERRDRFHRLISRVSVNAHTPLFIYYYVVCRRRLCMCICVKMEDEAK